MSRDRWPWILLGIGMGVILMALVVAASGGQYALYLVGGIVLVAAGLVLGMLRP
jgi:hypothetical protein